MNPADNPNPPENQVMPHETSQQSRQAFLHSIKDLLESLRSEISSIRNDIEKLDTLTADLPDGLDDASRLIRQLSERSQNLEKQIVEIEESIIEVKDTIIDPQKVSERLKPVLGSSFVSSVQEQPAIFSEAIAPLISPAIRSQIRNSRSDIISALYPIIGQTITKAISEAILELRRSIDARLQRSINLRQRIKQFVARLRGVSQADLLLGEALPYQVRHIFLIERKSGLLLEQICGSSGMEDADLVSAMLTAIRNFAHNAFGAAQDELEEIQHGDLRILLDAGPFVYLAVVIDGIEPGGYKNMMHDVIQSINLMHEESLRDFSGDLNGLPDFEPNLSILLQPSIDDLEHADRPEPLSRNQKTILGIGAVTILLALLLTVFACIFTIRLLPVAFPQPTHTLVPPTNTQTATGTLTITPQPTSTLTPLPSVTPISVEAVMTGNAWVYFEPNRSSGRFDLVIPINTPVRILSVYGDWTKIAWTSQYGYQEGWVTSRWVGIIKDVPDILITPVMTP